MTQQSISLLQNTTHTPKKKKQKTQKTLEIKILKEMWSSGKGSLMSYLTTGSLCTYD